MYGPTHACFASVLSEDATVALRVLQGKPLEGREVKLELASRKEKGQHQRPARPAAPTPSAKPAAVAAAPQPLKPKAKPQPKSLPQQPKAASEKPSEAAEAPAAKPTPRPHDPTLLLPNATETVVIFGLPESFSKKRLIKR